MALVDDSDSNSRCGWCSLDEVAAASFLLMQLEPSTDVDVFRCEAKAGEGMFHSFWSLPSQTAIFSRFFASVSPKCFVFCIFANAKSNCCVFKVFVAFASPKRWALPSQPAVSSRFLLPL